VTFGAPLYLLLLLVLPALAGLYWLSQRRRQRYAIRFTNVQLLRQVMGPGPSARRHLPPILFLLGVTALLLAMAGPAATLRVPTNQVSVMLCIDVSGSMQASDVQPTRLDAARSAAQTLIDNLPGNARVGLVSFSDVTTVAAPLNENHDAVKNALGTLQPNGGTAIGDGVEVALRQLVAGGAVHRTPSGRPTAMIVLLTDGASNTGEDPLQAAADAKSAGVPVQSIGVGSRDQNTYLGGRLIGGVDEQALQQISSTTGGHYYFANEAGQLQQIYSNLGSQFGWRLRHLDLTLPVMGLGAAILLVGGLLSLRWFRLLP
jgi:Ca-activated chloride channel family protein